MMNERIILPNIKRKPRAKLDAARLLGDKGFPLLLKLTKEFEVSDYGPKDLERYMEILQDWAHSLFPRIGFEDFISSIEKKCGDSELMNFLEEIFSTYETPK